MEIKPEYVNVELHMINGEKIGIAVETKYVNELLKSIGGQKAFIIGRGENTKFSVNLEHVCYAKTVG